MITNRPVEVSAQIIEETVMTALEKQFHDTAACMNMEEYMLHKRSEIALGYCYQAINHRDCEPKLIIKSQGLI
ncbi:MAG: hypothetical protein JZU65_06205 [Chlorobium sp.]|jgi:hypothetical protein|nr:hypothetical protein [Chlorobium sp.]